MRKVENSLQHRGTAEILHCNDFDKFFRIQKVSRFFYDFLKDTENKKKEKKTEEVVRNDSYPASCRLKIRWQSSKDHQNSRTKVRDMQQQRNNVISSAQGLIFPHFSSFFRKAYLRCPEILFGVLMSNETYSNFLRCLLWVFYVCVVFSLKIEKVICLFHWN